MSVFVNSLHLDVACIGGAWKKWAPRKNRAHLYASLSCCHFLSSLSSWWWCLSLPQNLQGCQIQCTYPKVIPYNLVPVCMKSVFFFNKCSELPHLKSCFIIGLHSSSLFRADNIISFTADFVPIDELKIILGQGLDIITSQRNFCSIKSHWILTGQVIGKKIVN